MPQFALDDLCTPPTVAALLRVSRPTIYAALRRREKALVHLRTPGGQIRIRRRDVLAYCHRVGLPVPTGLVPRPPDVMVVHPDADIRCRLVQELQPTFQVRTHHDIVDGLIDLGNLRPPLAMVSSRYGWELIDRLSRALQDTPRTDYICLVVLEREGRGYWTGGPVPCPLSMPEAPSAQGPSRREIIEKLLGLP